MNKQLLADKLHATFMIATQSGGTPWLAVAEAALEQPLIGENPSPDQLDFLRALDMPVSEPKYRMLERGEAIQTGDQYESPCFPGMWENVNRIGYIFCLERYLPHRRLVVVKVAEPQYRNLEHGETIQEGDEFHHQARPAGEWVPTRSIGTNFNAEGGLTYRRALVVDGVTDTVKVGDTPTREAAIEASHEDLHEVIARQRESIQSLECHVNLLASDLKQALNERNNWIDTAAQHSRNEDFYHGIVSDIGDMFGLIARVTDDGSICEDVLVLKVPELVAALIIKSNA